MFKTEDFWATIIGLLALAGIWIAWTTGSPLGHDMAVNAAGLHWRAWSQVDGFLASHSLDMIVQVSFFLAVLIGPVMLAGINGERFLVGFLGLFVLGVLSFALSGWADAATFELEPPVVALLIGLLVANTIGTPGWLTPATRVEMYIKTGIVLLGASFPLSLLLTGGMTPLAQAAVTTVVTVGVIYGLGRWVGLSHEQSAVLGTGAGVCGVSASMAAGAAVHAKRQEIYQAISLVILFSLLWVVALPLAARALGLTAGQGGAWIGSSELADAAGVAAAASFGGMIGHAGTALRAFTDVKVIGRDIWIGLWAIFWTFTSRGEVHTGHESLRGAAVTFWQRLPKFVLGFLVAAFTTSVLTRNVTPQVRTGILGPLVGLRSWAFVLCFLSIGLNTRIKQFFEIDRRTFAVFAVGVAANLIVGYLLSSTVFGPTWAAF